MFVHSICIYKSLGIYQSAGIRYDPLPHPIYFVVSYLLLFWHCIYTFIYSLCICICDDARPLRWEPHSPIHSHTTLHIPSLPLPLPRAVMVMEWSHTPHWPQALSSAPSCLFVYLRYFTLPPFCPVSLIHLWTGGCHCCCWWFPFTSFCSSRDHIYFIVVCFSSTFTFTLTRTVFLIILHSYDHFILCNSHSLRELRGTYRYLLFRITRICCCPSLTFLVTLPVIRHCWPLICIHLWPSFGGWCCVRSFRAICCYSLFPRRSFTLPFVHSRIGDISSTPILDTFIVIYIVHCCLHICVSQFIPPFLPLVVVVLLHPLILHIDPLKFRCNSLPLLLNHSFVAHSSFLPSFCCCCCWCCLTLFVATWVGGLGRGHFTFSRWGPASQVTISGGRRLFCRASGPGLHYIPIYPLHIFIYIPWHCVPLPLIPCYFVSVTPIIIIIMYCVICCYIYLYLMVVVMVMGVTPLSIPPPLTIVIASPPSTPYSPLMTPFVPPSITPFPQPLIIYSHYCVLLFLPCIPSLSPSCCCYCW